MKTGPAELILYAIINYIPYILLALMPFENSMRFSKAKTAVIFYSFSSVIIALFTVSYYLGDFWHTVSATFITFLSIFVYVACVKTQWGRMLFNLFMIKNVANFVVVTAKSIEGMLFPDTVRTLYSWTNSLCMLIVLCLVSPLIIFMVKHYFSEKIRDSINPSIWRLLWLIPVFFYIIWIYIFYYSTNDSPLELAIKPETAIFMAVFLCGQLFIYACIANLVLSFDTAAKLEMENHMLEEQSIQYKNIQNRIQDINRMKHDLRHHVIVISNFADEEKYDELKDYLHHYISMLPEHKLNFCKNASLNMLLVFYDQKCIEENIIFDVTLNLPNDLPLSDSDITVMFGNLLENSLDACMAMDSSQKRFISLSGQFFQNQLIFIIKNSYSNPFNVDKSGCILSTKHDGYGIGTASVRNIIRKYNGTGNITHDGNVFTISFFIPVE